jgi:hypothetical protein
MPKTVALDANLLVLLVVGLTNPAYIAKHKRLTAYDLDAFRLLTGMLSAYEDVVVTPNILTEASNLLNYIADPAKTEIAVVFRDVIARTKTKEIYVPSSQASGRAEFLRLGLTDSALLETCHDGISILSSDFDLWQAALTAGYEAINFNHERGLL